MNPMPPFTWGTLFNLILVMGCAVGVRIWYVAECADDGQRDPALAVQGRPRFHQTPPTDLDTLVENFRADGWFACRAPLADEVKTTAHVSPGYPLLLSLIAGPDAECLARWLQCALGSLTVLCYFFFARRAFHSTFIATLAGLLTAFYPFWIVNTAEINDGVLASFFVGAVLAFGARGGQSGGPFTGLAFGVALAGMALVRAALLPFALISLLWFLWECRRFPLGWFAAFLALVGFVNGLAPWAIRNYIIFSRPIPVVDSTYLHLWMGNNPRATGSTLDEATLRDSLPKDRLDALLAEQNQAKRYDQLAPDVWQEIQDHPAETLMRRVKATLIFLFGDSLFGKENTLALAQEAGADIAAPPAWLKDHAETILQATLLALLVLAFLGWRWSFPWRRYGRIGVLAVLFVPLPYVLSHGEASSGPRLPLDGVLLCYAAFALASLIPGLVCRPEYEK